MPAAPNNAGGPSLREPAVETATARPGAFRLRQIAPWAVAAAFAATALWFAGRNLALRSENLTLRSERQLAEAAYRMAQNQLTERSLLAERMIAELGGQLLRSEDLTRLKVTALASAAGHMNATRAITVWHPGQQTGLLTIEGLPAISDAQDYQIWIADPSRPDPVSGGVFHAGADGRVALGFKPDRPVTQAAGFSISLERRGGAPKPEGPVVLQGK